MSIPYQVQEFRKRYNEKLSVSYSGKTHLFLTVSLSLLGLILSLYFVSYFQWADILIIGLALVYANLVEYLGHRFLLHNVKLRETPFYREHTTYHHHYFTHDAIEVTHHRDFHRVLFSPIAIVFFVGLIGVPTSIIAGLFWGERIGLLILSASIGYFLLYEMLHLMSHLPTSHIVFRIPYLLKIREHHRMHHQLSLMGKFNFNVTFPLWDKVFKTTYR